MDRRDFLKTTSVAAVTFAANQTLFAKEAPAKDAAPAAANDKLATINKTALECFSVAQPCLAHCQDLLEKGNSKMARCLADVLNMSAMVETIVKLTGGRAVDPELLKPAITACSAFCKACAESCKPHLGHSPACKACKEACDRCADACDAYLKA